MPNTATDQDSTTTPSETTKRTVSKLTSDELTTAKSLYMSGTPRDALAKQFGLGIWAVSGLIKKWREEDGVPKKRKKGIPPTDAPTVQPVPRNGGIHNQPPPSLFPPTPVVKRIPTKVADTTAHIDQELQTLRARVLTLSAMVVDLQNELLSIYRPANRPKSTSSGALTAAAG